jgi:c-di-AMP phosphodiesterase-like protein
MALRWGVDVPVFVSVSGGGGHLAFAARALKTVAVGNAGMRFCTAQPHYCMDVQ